MKLRNVLRIVAIVLGLIAVIAFCAAVVYYGTLAAAHLGGAA